MDWPTIVTIVLGSSVMGAVINNLISGFSKTRERGRYNSFLALTLAYDFEKYAHHCVNLLTDDELYESSEGHAGKFIGCPPQSYDLPKVNFRDFDIKLLIGYLSFLKKPHSQRMRWFSYLTWSMMKLHMRLPAKTLLNSRIMLFL